MDLRFVYVLKSRGLYKIGLAGNVEQRLQSINNSLPSTHKARLVCKIRSWNAGNLEYRLHQKYEHGRRYYKGSGKTEWFNLGFFEALHLRWTFFWWKIRWAVYLALSISIYFIWNMK